MKKLEATAAEVSSKQATLHQLQVNELVNKDACTELESTFFDISGTPDEDALNKGEVSICMAIAVKISSSTDKGDLNER